MKSYCPAAATCDTTKLCVTTTALRFPSAGTTSKDTVTVALASSLCEYKSRGTEREDADAEDVERNVEERPQLEIETLITEPFFGEWPGAETLNTLIIEVDDDVFELRVDMRVDIIRTQTSYVKPTTKHWSAEGSKGEGNDKTLWG